MIHRIILTLLASVFAASAWAADFADGLKDPSFENAQGDSPSEWRVTLSDGAEGRISWTTEARTGHRALLVEKTNGLGSMMLSTVRSLAAKPKTDYASEVYLRVQKQEFGSKVYFVNRDLAADERILPGVHLSSLHDWVPRYSEPGQWQHHAATWTTSSETAGIQLQLILSGNPTTLVLDDFALVESPAPVVNRGKYDSNEKPFDEAVARANLARRQVMPSRVETRGDQPAFVVGDMVRSALVHQGAYGSPQASRYGGFGKCGIHLHTCTVQMGPQVERPNVAWKYPNGFDFTQLERDLLQAVCADPDACVILQVRCDMPQAWSLEHPDDVWMAEDGQRWTLPVSHCHATEKRPVAAKGETYFASYGSPAYQHDIATALTELGKFVATSDVGKIVVGFVIGGGCDGQFLDCARELDHSPGHRQGFQQWLREIYSGDVAALRKAWDDPQVTFETAAITPEAMRGVHTPVLAMSGAERRAADSNHYAAVSPARLIKHCAKSLKQAIGRPVFSMCYYPDAITGQGIFGIYGLSEVLAGPDRIDSAVAVQNYGEWRQLGGTGGTNGSWGSHRLRGTVQLCEIDYRTYRCGVSPPWGVGELGMPLSAEGFRAQIRRDLGATASRGMGAWYYDMSGGWYDDPDLWSVVKESNQILDWTHRADAPSPKAEMAVFVDEEAGWRFSLSLYGMVFGAHSEQRRSLNLSGVPYDLYLQDDIRRDDLPEYRTYVFLSAFTMNEEQVAAAKKRCRGPGKVVVLPASLGLGVSDKSRQAFAEALSGMKCDILPKGAAIACTPVTDCAHPIAADLRGAFVSDGNAPADLLVPADPNATVFGRFVHGGKPSHAISTTADGTGIVFVGPLTPQLLHNAAKISGIKMVGTPGQSSYLGCGVAVCHRVQPGPATVRFSEPVDLLELDGTTVIAHAVTEWNPDCKLLDTAVVFYRPAK